MVPNRKQNNHLSQIPIFHKFCHSDRIGTTSQIILNTHKETTTQGGCVHGQAHQRYSQSLNSSITCFDPVSSHE